MNVGEVNIELENLSNGHVNGHTSTYEEDEVFDDRAERGLLSSELKPRLRERPWHQVKNIVIEVTSSPFYALYNPVLERTNPAVNRNRPALHW